MNIKLLLSECLKGRSLGRTLHNLSLQNRTMYGDTIDVGAKNGEGSYYKFIKICGNITFCDFYSKSSDVLKIDFEEKLPIPDESFDCVLAMNVLEHIFNHQQFVSEIARITKNNGKLFGFVPFLWQFHADPNDYYRYTHQCLERLLIEAGYSMVEIKPIGVGRFTVAANILSKLLKFKPIVFLFWVCFLGFDRMLSKVSTSNLNYYVGLEFSASK